MFSKPHCDLHDMETINRSVRSRRRRGITPQALFAWMADGYTSYHEEIKNILRCWPYITQTSLRHWWVEDGHSQCTWRKIFWHLPGDYLSLCVTKLIKQPLPPTHVLVTVPQLTTPKNTCPPPLLLCLVISAQSILSLVRREYRPPGLTPSFVFYFFSV